ncbi:MAG: hypothetical protein WCJ57_03330 [Candidatus Falkowbacteria bacterium]
MKDLSKEMLESLHRNYGKTASAEITLALENKKMIPVFTYHDKKEKKFGLHEVSESIIARIKSVPREDFFSINFLSPGAYRSDLERYKTIVVLVETVSGFSAFNVGEVFDQLTDEDKENTKGFYFDFDSLVTHDDAYSLAYVTLYK